MRISKVSTLVVQLAIWAIAGLSVFGLVWRYYPMRGKELILAMNVAVLISQLVVQPGLYWWVGQKSLSRALLLGWVLAGSLWFLHALSMMGLLLVAHLLLQNSPIIAAVVTDRAALVLLMAASAASFIWLYPKIDRSLMLDQTAAAQRPAANFTILLANSGAYIFALIFIWLAIGWLAPVEFRGW